MSLKLSAVTLRDEHTLSLCFLKRLYLILVSCFICRCGRLFNKYLSTPTSTFCLGCRVFATAAGTDMMWREDLSGLAQHVSCLLLLLFHKRRIKPRLPLLTQPGSQRLTPGADLAQPPFMHSLKGPSLAQLNPTPLDLYTYANECLLLKATGF